MKELRGGAKVAEACRGSPLFARVLGQVTRGERDDGTSRRHGAHLIFTFMLRRPCAAVIRQLARPCDRPRPPEGSSMPMVSRDFNIPGLNGGAGGFARGRKGVLTDASYREEKMFAMCG